MSRLDMQAVTIMGKVYNIELYIAISDVSSIPSLNKERLLFLGLKSTFLRPGLFNT
jgi:hypothetical protein